MNLGAREERTLRLACLALVVFALYAWGFRPTLALLSRVREERALQDELRGARLLLDDAAEIRRGGEELARALSAEEGRFFARMAVEQASLRLLRIVEELAARAGLSLQSKSYGPAGSGESPPEIRVEVSGKGSAAAVIRFLLGLRDSAVPLEIERLDIKADRQEHQLELRAVVATMLLREGGGRVDG